MTYFSFFRVAVIVFFSSAFYGQCSDFISVDGKKLKCGQNDFFAVSTNYVVQVMHTCGSNFEPVTIQNHFPTRAHMYSPDNKFEPEIRDKVQGYNALVNDFTAMKAKGFNTVRVVGVSYGSIESLDCTETDNFTIPYTNSNFNQLLLDIHQNILDAASQAGLKVILLLGEASSVIPYSVNGSVAPLAETNGYIVYLKQFAQKFKNNPTLLAVDFVNEPDVSVRESKTNICNLTKTWNDAIKSNSDILTTIGTLSNGVYDWDPNVMHIDFASIHNYPLLVDKVNLTDLGMAIDRIKSDYYWYSNNVTIPWMVGETGLSAHPNNTSHPINSTGSWDHGTGGTLQDQADYLAATLAASRDFGAIGYSWWTFMDEHVGLNYSNQAITNGPFWGVAYSNEGNTTTVWKPSANYISSFNPVRGSLPNQPNNYYNYYNTPNNGRYALGRVTSSPNVGIKDAVIEIRDNQNKLFYYYTDGNGFYTAFSDDYIVHIKISAVECNKYEDYFNVPNFTSNIIFKSVQLDKISRSVSNILTYANQGVAGVTINDHSESYATFSNYQTLSSEINVTAQDYIRLGAGTLIYPDNNFSATIGNYYHNCNSIIDAGNVAFRIMKKDSVPKIPQHNELLNTNIFPNPGAGIYHIETAKEGEYQVEIFNVYGALVKTYSFDNHKGEIHLENESSGVYLFTLKDKEKNIQYFKIVKE